MDDGCVSQYMNRRAARGNDLYCHSSESYTAVDEKCALAASEAANSSNTSTKTDDEVKFVLQCY